MSEEQYVLYENGIPIGWFSDRNDARNAFKKYVRDGFIKTGG